MKYIFLLLVGVMTWSADSRAQPVPPDPQVTVYDQFLIDANRRLVQAGAQTITLQQENQKLREENARLKAEKAAPHDTPSEK